jgi:hypothetical protein
MVRLDPVNSAYRKSHEHQCTVAAANDSYSKHLASDHGGRKGFGGERG